MIFKIRLPQSSGILATLSEGFGSWSQSLIPMLVLDDSKSMLMTQTTHQSFINTLWSPGSPVYLT